MPEIIHHEEQGRFEMLVEGHLCELDYQLRNGAMAILHTGVPDAVGGRGIAGQLTRAALDTARQRGWQVQPVCSYAASYLDRHPEYHDLLA
ncbi:GNAT family N-acetyltransferase [Bordetella petrii]|uniref:GNAT family N-acetyltransferase n=1 Tax=Bordetella petrii TaxID=94624 RepID=UPI001E39C44C|nr:GNAT family N-acetyltransferase [Bordetella petrii]MCD0504797.1 N-acetyltransferase [Bordetella petrii]